MHARRHVRVVFTTLLVAAAASTGCQSTNPYSGPNGLDPQPPLERGRRAYEAAEYEKAREALRPVAQADPPRAESMEAAFLLAESYYHAGSRGKALNAYRDYVERFPIADHLETAESRIFEIGLLYLEGRIRTGFGLFTHRARGVGALEFLLQSFPRGRKTAEAQRVLADYYFRRDRWIEAIAEYRELVRRFPRNEWVALARYRIGLAYAAQVRGASYDPRILESAREALQAYVDLHPEGIHADDAREELSRLGADLAEKIYETGRFYERNDEDAAAAMYYRETMERFPGTDSAARAEKRLAALPESAGESTFRSPGGPR